MSTVNTQAGGRLLAELIDIPERSAQEDFVLKLVDGVRTERAGRTIDDYVITDTIKARLGEALTLIQNALGLEVRGGEARLARAITPGIGCYLDGSFGSGKSHFMAFLHRMLTGDQHALGREELHDLVAAHGPWLAGRRFLLVPCHMISADSTEQRIYEGYVQAIRAEHAEAGLPLLFKDDRVIGVLRTIRETGEAGLLAKLNAGGDRGAGTAAATNEDGWGDFGDSGQWTPERLARALEAPSGDSDRQQLVMTAIERVLGEYAETSDCEPIGVGLERMTTHAKALGYDGLVLFLDEFILWLASRSGDLAFLQREVAKLLQVVEGQHMDRPIPVVAFIARQKRLSALVGSTSIGAELQAIDDQLTHHEGRFRSIALELMDLPTVASRRLLRPRTPEARQELDAEFARLVQNDRTWQALAGADGNRDAFRQIYPFSPVLVKSLVAAASLLQRDRTALKAMQQLLVHRRESLRVGEVVPIGDLWAVVGSGREAISSASEDLFRVANQLRRNKLMPLIETDHGLTEDEVGRLPADDPRRKRFTMDRRIVDTLLLAAVVPGVVDLKDLTADRIARLNHGSISSPIPGGEAATVLRRVRAWANEVAEVQLGEDLANPTIRLQLDSFDIERIIRNGDAYDQKGARVTLIRRMIREQLQVEDVDGRTVIEVPWKGLDREVEIVFSNVCEMTTRSLRHEGPGWKVVIDEPLDDRPPGEADAADREVISRFRTEAAGDPSLGGRTLLWRPRFLGGRALSELGKLVKLEHILRSDTTFADATPHLAEEDRPRARVMLEGLQRNLKSTLARLLIVAYGLGQDADLRERLDATVEIERPFESLDPSFAPRTPGVCANLRQGLDAVLNHAFGHVFPKAPDWPDDVRRTDARKLLELLHRAMADPQHRAVMDDAAQRRIGQQIGAPLGLAPSGAVFAPDDTWLNRFRQAAAAAGENLDHGVTVAQLRTWIDHEGATGLPNEWRDVVIIAFAERSAFEISRARRPLESLEPGQLQPTDELRPVPLPSQEDWQLAQDVAGSAFGVSVEAMFLSAAFMEALQSRVVEVIAESAGLGPQERSDRRLIYPRMRAKLEDLKRSLASRGAAGGPRVCDVDAALDLVAKLEGAGSARDAVEVLAQFAPASPSSATTAGFTMRQAVEDLAALKDENDWRMLQGACTREGAAAAGLQADLDAVLQGQPHQRQLARELPPLVARATQILVGPATPPGPGPEAGPGPVVPPPPPPPPPPTEGAVAGRVRLAPGETADAVRAAVDAFRREHPEAAIEVSWRTLSEEDAG